MRLREALGLTLRPRNVIAWSVLLGLTAPWAAMVMMPGCGHRGPLPPLTAGQSALAGELRRDVESLVQGRRNLDHPEELARAERQVRESLQQAGLKVTRETYRPPVADGVEGQQEVANLHVELRGHRRPGEIVVIGAHYDASPGTPGADDNASGTAALLALARRLGGPAAAGWRPARTLRLSAYVNEEPPYFQTEQMGSLVAARRAAARGDRVVAMLSLETLGYYRDEPGSQRYPFPFNLFYPSRGNFVAFVGNLDSRSLVRRLIRSFRRHTAFPSEGAAVPAFVPGIGWSDHWSFWQIGVPAVMVTDTAPFRNPGYHQPTDTPATLDHERLARVVDGLLPVIRELAE